MKLTTERPTEPGLYWFHDDRPLYAPEICRVEERGIIAWMGHDDRSYPNEGRLRGRWLGPIPYPEELT